jgi:ATP-dependent Clp protease protease subunit
MKNKISDDTIHILHEYAVRIESRELFLNSYIGNVDEEPGVDYRMSVKFIKNINLLNSSDDKPIVIHMNTVGGAWTDGMAIYDSILASASQVTIVTYAEASSMSSIILQAADLRLLMPNTEVMVHFGSSGGDDNSLAVISAAQREKRNLERMLKLYARRCIEGPHFAGQKNITQQKVINYLRKKMEKYQDWWMDAEEAIYYGFADGIVDGENYSMGEIMRGEI